MVAENFYRACNKKRGKKTIRANVKTIEAYLSSLMRVKYTWEFWRVGLKRVWKILNEAQYGFGPGRRTVDLVFSLKMLNEKNWEWDREMYIVFINLKKAFDSVPREKM